MVVVETLFKSFPSKPITLSKAFRKWLNIALKQTIPFDSIDNLIYPKGKRIGGRASTRSETLLSKTLIYN